MNVTIRSKGHDILVRGPGRRVRITREWTSVSDVVFERVQAEAGNLIEIKGDAVRVPVQVDVAAPEAGPVVVDRGPESAGEESPPAPAPSPATGKKSRKAMRAQAAQDKQDTTREGAQ